MSRGQKLAIGLVPVGLLVLALLAALMSAGRTARGNFGYQPDPVGAREFAAEVGSFREVGADALRNATGKNVFLYRYAYQMHRKVYGTEWECLDQGAAGTCVSFAFALAAFTANAVDHVEAADKVPATPSVASEPLYGGARTWGVGRASHPGMDGATGFGAARWVSGNCPGRDGVGGVLFRQVYGDYDLTRYSIPLSREWGRVGVPSELARLAFNTRASAVANVTTWAELVASLERGSCVVLCSNVGYGRRDGQMPIRDPDGFLPRGTPWGHAMCVWAVRHRNPDGTGREGALVQNSWSGRWSGGAKWPSDQPDGSFWAERADIEAALEQGDCWAVGGSTSGFRWRELDHGGWMKGEGHDG